MGTGGTAGLFNFVKRVACLNFNRRLMETWTGGGPWLFHFVKRVACLTLIQEACDDREQVVGQCYQLRGLPWPPYNAMAPPNNHRACICSPMLKGPMHRDRLVGQTGQTEQTEGYLRHLLLIAHPTVIPTGVAQSLSSHQVITNPDDLPNDLADHLGLHKEREKPL